MDRALVTVVAITVVALGAWKVYGLRVAVYIWGSLMLLAGYAYLGEF